MVNMIKIKAVSGSETIYRNFYNEKNVSVSRFIKDSKNTFCGFDTLRVVKKVQAGI